MSDILVETSPYIPEGHWVIVNPAARPALLTPRVVVTSTPSGKSWLRKAHVKTPADKFIDAAREICRREDEAHGRG